MCIHQHIDMQVLRNSRITSRPRELWTKLVTKMLYDFTFFLHNVAIQHAVGPLVLKRNHNITCHFIMCLQCITMTIAVIDSILSVECKSELPGCCSATLCTKNVVMQNFAISILVSSFTQYTYCACYSNVLLEIIINIYS